MADADQPPHSLKLGPADVPALRRELADWYGGPQGVMFYSNALALGRQQIRPPGPPEKVAPLLAAAETSRLRNGDLWYIDEDMCALLNAAHRTMPVFAPRPEDLPSKVGFAVFAEPLFVYDTAEARHDTLSDALQRAGTDEFRRLSKQMEADTTEIMAVSWSPVNNPHWRAGGIWLSFYAPAWAASRDLDINAAAKQRLRAMLPTMTVDNEATIAWRPDGTPAQDYQLPTAATDRSTLSWTRLVFAAFQLAAQSNLAETDQLPTPRPERRRAQRAGLPERDVRIVRLRHSILTARDTEQSDGTREWRHRWVVRGHWRNHWYPSLKDHRPIWIAPYLKGPADAPLLGGDKVTVITGSQPAGPEGNQPDRGPGNAATQT